MTELILEKDFRFTEGKQEGAMPITCVMQSTHYTALKEVYIGAISLSYHQLRLAG